LEEEKMLKMRKNRAIKKYIWKEKLIINIGVPFWSYQHIL